MDWMTWYNSLAKPSWTPSPATIGLIWSILYPVIIVSFGFVFVQAGRKKLHWMISLPFAINLVANLLFMPLFSGLRSVELAAADIIIVWATIIWCAIAIWPHYRWVAIAQLPYFVWVSIASVLQIAITTMNWGR
ncbi:MAG: TspO/MBR family protein [Zavarzinella sp.]